MLMDLFTLKHALRYRGIQLLDPWVARWMDLKQAFLHDPSSYQRYEDDPPVGTLFVDNTNICNARCVFCAYPYINEKEKGTLPLRLFQQVVDEYAAMGGKVVSLSPTVGDPLVDPGLIDKLRYAVQSPGIEKVNIYTNGILLGHKEVYKELVHSGVSALCISTAGMDRQMFEDVFKVKKYEELREGLRALIQYNRDQGEPLFIRMKFRPSRPPAHVISSPDFQEIIRPYLSAKLDVQFKPVFDNWGGSAGTDWMVGSMKLMKGLKQRRVPCYRTFDLSVLIDGSIRLCGCRIKDTAWDELVIGRLGERSLLEIYRSEKCREVRRRFVEGRHPEACRDCSMYEPVTGFALRGTSGRGAGRVVLDRRHES
jgi:organic radical activating enzyme